MKPGWLLLAVFMARSVFAHRVDDLLQAAFVEITADEARVQLHLNPGIEVADKLIWLIDSNGDKQLSQSEVDRFARDFTSKTGLVLDGKALEVRFVSAEADAATALRAGDGNVHISLRAKLPLRTGDHVLRFENKNLPEWSAYLVNATIPKDPAIQVLKQERNDAQSFAKIAFSMRAPTSAKTLTAR